MPEISNKPPRPQGGPFSWLVKPYHISPLAPIERALRSFSPAERGLLYVFTILLGLSSFILIANANYETTSVVPRYGGSLTEGIVGTPRFVNPILATSAVDESLIKLVYSGLMRVTPSGELIPDLASGYEISDDRTTYTFRIREDAQFHDGTPVRAKDVALTIEMAKQSNIKSPRRADWEGVSVIEVDERTVQFVLPHAYAPFLENTTLGILPSHLWEHVPGEDVPFHQLNTNPIGSGPYQLDRTRSDKSGTIREYTFRAFPAFTLGKPYISTITTVFYPNEEALLVALAQEEVESAAGMSAESVKNISLSATSQIVSDPLPRVFAIFFNQNQAPLFTDLAVRKALNAALDKQAIVDEVFGGFGKSLDGPLPSGVLLHASPTPPTHQGAQSASEDAPTPIEAARDILSRNGWEQNEETGVFEKDDVSLSFSLVTSNTPELTSTAEAVIRAWRELGAEVTVQAHGANDFNAAVVRPREYEALLFGQVVGRTLDLFAFWHSSQRNDPGLNLALYANTQVDRLLTEARTETDRALREEKYREFETIIQEELPAIFLYAPEFIYIIPKHLHGISLGLLATPAERFLNVHEWHVETERVWDIFIQ